MLSTDRALGAIGEEFYLFHYLDNAGMHTHTHTYIYTYIYIYKYICIHNVIKGVVVPTPLLLYYNIYFLS